MVYKIRSDSIIKYGGMHRFINTNSINNGKSLYEEISFSEVYFISYHDKDHLDDNEIYYLNGLLNNICDISSLDKIHIMNSISFEGKFSDPSMVISFGIDDIIIYKYSDDWYLLCAISYYNNKYKDYYHGYTSPILVIKYFKSDTFDGVKQLLNDLLYGG